MAEVPLVLLLFSVWSQLSVWIGEARSLLGLHQLRCGWSSPPGNQHLEEQSLLLVLLK